jgi:hypothetical protein
MGGKSTLALTVILVAVVGYIYFVDSRKPVSDVETKDKAFSGLTAEDIEEVQITSDAGETTRLQKAGGKWQIVEPVKADADNTEASNIASTLASVDLQRVVDENASNLKDYGLDPARVEVAFRAKGKKDMARLLIGEKTPTGGDLYARLPDGKRVFLVSAFLDSTFNKNTFALRDKKVLTIDREKVDSLEFADAGRTLRFVKRGSDWRMVAPVDARADFSTVESAVERVASLQMQGITADSTPDLRKFGLDKPSATITVGQNGGAAAPQGQDGAGGSLQGRPGTATLLLGKTENAVVYAKDASRPMIFTVAPTLTTDLFKDVGDYRRKDLFDARSFTMDRITFTRGGNTITLDKSKAKDGKDVWKDAAGKEIDAAKADDLLARVGSLRADTFQPAASPALQTPDLTVTARFDGGKMETVTFARSGNTVVASRSDEPGSATVETMSYEDVIKGIEGVK